MTLSEDLTQAANRGDEKRFLEALVDESWDESKDPLDGQGEIRDRVPKPNIVIEGNQGSFDRSQHYSDNDIAFILDDGNAVFEPASVGHTEEKQEVKLAVELYTSQGEERFYGPDGSTYGGIVGETSRILDSVRNGIGPFDRINKKTFSDETAGYGADTWVGSWSLETIKYATTIGQDKVR